MARLAKGMPRKQEEDRNENSVYWGFEYIWV